VGDFQNWQNGPKDSEPKHHSLLPSYDFKKQVRAERIRILVWLLFFVGLILLGIRWHQGWRP
jgi:hypothetical protein